MADGIGESSGAAALDQRIMSAQAASLLQNVGLSLVSSCFIAVTTAVILWLHNPHYIIVLWLVILSGLNAARYVGVAFIVRRKLFETAPAFTLDFLSLSALCAGLVWALAPFISSNFAPAAPSAYIMFIIAGISAGALMQSTAYSRTAVLFATPPLATTLFLLVSHANVLSTVIAIDVLLLAVMMIRASRTSEAGFIRSQEDRLRAMELACSLAGANREISLSNQRLEALANLDPLTGLGNRALFNTHLQSLVDRQDERLEVALLIIDLDRFKTINDTMGHGAGDAVLVEISKRLSALAGPGDTVVRLGGDEFAVVIAGEDAAGRAGIIAGAMLDAADEPVLVYGRPVTAGASIGLAVFPEHGRSAETLFASADIALYAAKDSGRRRVNTFNPALKAQIERQRQIETSLPAALAANEIGIFVQPQVTLADYRVVGLEILIRWTHPVLGPVSPPEIVLAAQSLHISERLTRYVAEAAAALAVRLEKLGLGDTIVSINVSPREFSAYSLTSMLCSVTAAHGVDPSRIEIEITEEATLDAVTAGEELARLEKAGFRLAVDDFGMGHSSLAYLVNLRIDRLKIDRNFVTGISRSRQNQALIAALVGIGHALSIGIVVEGVETTDEAEVLRMIGCQVIQGYYSGRPFPVENIETWLATRQPPPNFGLLDNIA